MRRLAAAVVVAFALLAAAADLVASDVPLILHRGGETTAFPGDRELGGARGEAISATLREGDWALWPPIRHDPTSVRTGGRLEVLSPPSPGHWLGTDDRGRDVLARLIHGARASLALAALVAAGALAIGLGLAALALLGGRGADASVAWLADLGAGIPVILFVVAAQGLWGAATLAAAAALLVIPRAADTTRIARAALGRAMASNYAEAARAAGAGGLRIALRHALPNAAPQLAVATAITGATTVLAEVALSFLGFGTPPPAASWGELLAQALAHPEAWWLLWPPALCVAILAGALGALSRSGR